VLDDLDLLRQLAARRLVAVGLRSPASIRASPLAGTARASPAKRMAALGTLRGRHSRARGRFTDHPGDHRSFPKKS
jgi:hypothetical protein